MEKFRSLLTTYAYNILGSLEEAKDIVQDVFLQYMEICSDNVKDEQAYLIRMVINRSINHKQRQKKLLTSYPGIWLPEPVASENTDAAINRTEMLSYSLMILLENMNARQRAVFILREAYDYEHAKIAALLSITVEHSRQLLKRAKNKLTNIEPVDVDTPNGYLEKYMQVIRSADIDALEKFLNEDIALTSDGGGKATAALHPVKGKRSVGAFLVGVYKKFYQSAHIVPAIINHQPALIYLQDDKIINCQVFAFRNGRIDRLFFIRNPDKLKSLQEDYKKCHV